MPSKVPSDCIRSARIVPHAIASWSHPPGTALRLRDRGVEGGGEGKRQHLARFCRVDDAVVPEASRGIERVPLALVLLEDRRAERGFLFGGPRAALALDALALDQRQDGRGLFA